MTAVNYLWNPLNDNIVREFDDAGAVAAEYTTEPDQFGNVVSQRRDGEDDYFHFDGVGSTLAVTNQAGTVTDTRAYTAFGETTEQPGTTVFPFQYVGRSGYYMGGQTDDCNVRRRALTTSVGRWLSVDPNRTRDYSWHAYEYATNSPLILVDPSGLQPNPFQPPVPIGPPPPDPALTAFLYVIAPCLLGAGGGVLLERAGRLLRGDKLLSPSWLMEPIAAGGHNG